MAVSNPHIVNGSRNIGSKSLFTRVFEKMMFTGMLKQERKEIANQLIREDSAIYHDFYVAAI